MSEGEPVSKHVGGKNSMDSRKEIAGYTKPSLFHTIVAWTAMILFAACLFTGIAKAVVNGKKQEEPFDGVNAEKYNPYYIDVVGISNWFYKERIDNSSHEFCIALDNNDEYHVVEISVRDERNLDPQAAYWRGESDTAPEPYRLYGWALPIADKSDLQSQLYFASGVGSYNELKELFGTAYLTTFRTGSLDIYFVGALGFGFIGIVAMLTWLGKRAVMKRCLDALEVSGRIDPAARELQNFASKEHCILGDCFLFAKHQGVVVPYEDIRECRIKTSKDGIWLTAASFRNCAVKMNREGISRLEEILQNKNTNK